ncbi:MAG TPA: phosphotransferase [Tepidisphaeraceae bacterium]|nr:phosphotransferase [Tepidisphaeraceae bacterium]
MSNALDIEDFDALLAYLRGAGRIGQDETPICVNLAGGVSNRTVLLRRHNGKSWVLKQALSRLRVQTEWLSDPRRIEREALGMLRLADLAPAGSITRLDFLDPGHNLLAMEAVPSPHENWKAVLLDGRLKADHIRQFAVLLGAIHRKGFERRDSLAPLFDDRSFFESLRLEPYYLYTAEQVPAAAGFLRDLVAAARSTRYTLVHGDYSPKNVLIHEDRLILLDHEVIHFGDGAFDLGFSLTHLMSKAHHLGSMRAEFAAAATEYWRVYREAIGDAPWTADLEPRVVRHTLGCLLARCRGRSPLEYLDAEERRRQAEAAVAMIARPPGNVQELIGEFLGRVDGAGNAGTGTFAFGRS